MDCGHFRFGITKDTSSFRQPKVGDILISDFTKIKIIWISEQIEWHDLKDCVVKYKVFGNIDDEEYESLYSVLISNFSFLDEHGPNEWDSHSFGHNVFPFYVFATESCIPLGMILFIAIIFLVSSAI